MNWISRLLASFGAPFLSLITSIYWTQGFRSLPWMAISYQLKDKLQLSPSASQSALTFAFMPWSVKPLYGILSDCVPIKGSRRISYLMISGILSFISWLILGLCETIRMSSLYMTGLLVLQNFGTAMADVVIDAMIAEATRKERADYAGDLQSMSWFAMALGGMFGSVVGGFALSAVDVKGIFLFFTIFPLSQLFLCSLVDERALIRKVTDQEEETTVEFFQEKEPPCKDESLFNVEDKATCESTMQPSKGLLEENVVKERENGDSTCEVPLDEDEDWIEVEANSAEDASAGDETSSIIEHEDENVSALKGSVHLGPDLSHVPQLHQRRGSQKTNEERKDNTSNVEKLRDLSVSSRLREAFKILFRTIRQPAIRQPMVWFFLAQICVPSLSTIMFYYQTNHLQLDASFLGMSRLIGWGALILGTFVYNHYLKNVQLRRIFWWTHIGLAFITLSDTILVSGLSNRLGISNKVFIVGASALGDAVNQFKFMPFLVLSGRLCEPGIEGTLFALFMSLNNLGSTLSSFFGAGLASVLRISGNQFDNFTLGICIQALCTIFPIFFLRWIPEGTGAAIQKFD